MSSNNYKYMFTNIKVGSLAFGIQGKTLSIDYFDILIGTEKQDM